MSIQEIEQAIARLPKSEVDLLAEWLANFRAQSEHERGAIDNQGSPITLAEAMGDLLGAVGRDGAGGQTSSRESGQTFTDYLVIKKREHRL